MQQPSKQPLIVTLDGPAGSGKSTVARRLAKRLGIEFLDTGAMYRGLTAYCLAAGIDPARQTAAVIQTTKKLQLRFDWTTDPPRLHAGSPEGDSDLTDRLRDPDVTAAASPLAAIKEVRQILVHAQQQIAREHPRIVTEGRDQGSVVFPDAQVKFYLDAQPAVRARRRAEQLRELGKAANEPQILAQIVERDHRDANRPDGPLICPNDALRIDTSDMSLDQVVEMLERCVRQRAAQALRPTQSSQPAGGRSA